MKKIAFYATLLFLYSCEYIPSEIPVTKIEKPVAGPSIQIELTPYMDTLRISGPIWVTYSARTGDHEVYLHYVQIDSVFLSDPDDISINPENIRAYINTNYFEDGVHDLKMTIYTATNSGSIADQAKMEVFPYILHWPVLINKRARQSFRLNPVIPFAGGVKLSWPEYRYADFSLYKFSWHSDASEGSTNISDPRQISFVDSTLVEGCYSRYSVYLYFTDGGYIYDDIIFVKDINNPLVKINSDWTVDITLDHPVNEKYVQQYCLKTSAPNYGIPEHHDITDLNDTTLHLSNKIGFGGDYSVRIKYIPKNFNNYHDVLNTSGGVTYFAVGDSVPGYEKAFHVPAQYYLLLYKSGTFFKYFYLTGETYAVLTQQSADLRTILSSPDGNYFGFSNNGKYFLYRSSDLSLINSIDVQKYPVLTDISISNNGHICILENGKDLRLFDINSGTNYALTRIDPSYYLTKLFISPDGRNLAIMFFKDSYRNTLAYYEVNGDQLTELGRVEGTGQDYSAIIAYSPEAQHKIIISHWISTYLYRVEMRDTRTFEVLHSVDVPKLFVPISYDFATDQVICQYQFFPTKPFSLLINMNTGNINNIIQFTGKSPYMFINGNVYSGNGRSINIADYILY